MQSDSVNHAAEALPAEAGLGERLRQMREARGESVGEVAEALKLSRRQVEALESGDFAALPGPAFARGFLRNYARHLGLDPQRALAEAGLLEARPAVDLTPVSNAAGDMPSGGRARNSVLPAAMAVVALLAVVFAGTYFGWFEITPEGEIPVGTEVVEPMSAPDMAPAEAGAGAEPADAVSAPALDAPPPAPPGAPASALPPVQPPVAAAVAPPVAAPNAPVVPGTADAAGELRFRFSGDAWIEVRDAGGKIVFSGVTAAGATRNVRGTAPFALVIGNASGVSLEYNGKAIDLVPHTKVAVARLTVQ